MRWTTLLPLAALAMLTTGCGPEVNDHGLELCGNDWRWHRAADVAYCIDGASVCVWGDPDVTGGKFWRIDIDGERADGGYAGPGSGSCSDPVECGPVELWAGPIGTDGARQRITVPCD